MKKERKANKFLVSTMATVVAVSVLPTTPMEIVKAASNDATMTVSEIKTISLTGALRKKITDSDSGYVFTQETLDAFKLKVEDMYGTSSRTLTKNEVQSILRIAVDDLLIKNKAEAQAVITTGTEEEKIQYINDRISIYNLGSYLSKTVDTSVLELFKGLDSVIDSKIDKVLTGKSKAQSILNTMVTILPSNDTVNFELDQATSLMTQIQGYRDSSETKDDLLTRYDYKMSVVYDIEMELINLINQYKDNVNNLSYTQYKELEELYNKIPASKQANYQSEITNIDQRFEEYLESTGYGSIYKKIEQADVKTLTNIWFTTVRAEISKVTNANIKSELTNLLAKLENDYKVWESYTTLKTSIDNVDVTRTTKSVLEGLRSQISLLDSRIVSTSLKTQANTLIDSKIKQVDEYATLLDIEVKVGTATSDTYTEVELNQFTNTIKAMIKGDHNKTRIENTLILIEQLKLEQVEYADYGVLERKANNVMNGNMGYEKAIDVFMEIVQYQEANSKSTFYDDSAEMLKNLKNYMDTIQATLKFNVSKQFEATNVTGKEKTVTVQVLDKALQMYKFVNHADYTKQVEEATERLRLIKLGLDGSEEAELEINAINAYNEANKRVLSQAYVDKARTTQKAMYTGVAKDSMNTKVTKLETELKKVQEVQGILGDFSQVRTETITNEKLDKIKTIVNTIEHELSKEVLSNSFKTYENILTGLVKDIETTLATLEKSSKVYEAYVNSLQYKMDRLYTGHSKYADFSKRLDVLKLKVQGQTLLQRIEDYIYIGVVDKKTVDNLKADYSKVGNIDADEKKLIDEKLKLLDNVLLIQSKIDDIKVKLDKAHSEGIEESQLKLLGDDIDKLPKGKIKDNLAKQVEELGYAFKKVNGIYEKTVSKTDLLKGVEISKGIRASVPHGTLKGVNNINYIEITYTEQDNNLGESFTIDIKDGTTGRVIDSYGGGIVLTFNQEVMKVNTSQTIQLIDEVDTTSNKDQELTYYGTPYKTTASTVTMGVPIADGDYIIKGKNVRNFKDTGSSANVQYINKLVGRGIVSGTTATTYSPTNNITRGQFSAMLVRSIGLSTLDKTNNNSFSDTTTHWSKHDIQVLADLGVISGYTNGTFKPNATLTRQQASLMIHRLLNNVGYDLNGVGLTKAEVKAKYKDSKSMTEEGLVSIGVLTELGILGGKTNGTFDPNGKLTRDQMSKVLYKTLELVGYIN